MVAIDTNGEHHSIHEDLFNINIHIVDVFATLVRGVFMLILDIVFIVLNFDNMIIIIFKL